MFYLKELAEKRVLFLGKRREECAIFRDQGN